MARSRIAAARGLSPAWGVARAYAQRWNRAHREQRDRTINHLFERNFLLIQRVRRSRIKSSPHSRNKLI